MANFSASWPLSSPHYTFIYDIPPLILGDNTRLTTFISSDRRNEARSSPDESGTKLLVCMQLGMVLHSTACNVLLVVFVKIV